MNYREEREIDLIDLAREILKKWKIIVLCMVIGLALGSVGGYFKSAQLVNAETLEPIVEDEKIEKNLEELKEDLSEREILEVKEAVKAYLSYKKVYEEKAKYGDTSIRMQLNSQSVPTMTASYIIGDYYEVTYPKIDEVNYISNIVSIYAKKLTDEDIVIDVARALGDNIPESYAKEVYSVYSEANSILSITVTARTKDECQKVMDVLTERLESEAASVKRMYTHSITYLDTFYSKNVNNSVLSEQQSQADSLASLEKTMLTVGSSLTTNQKSYFTALVNEEVKTKDVDTIIQRKFSIKFAALGFMAGAFFIIMWICAKYILTQTIKTKDEFKNLFGLNVLGTISNECENLGMITAGAQIGAKKIEAKKLYVASSLTDEQHTASYSKIVDAIQTGAGDITVDSGESILVNPASLEKLSAADGVIFVEKLKASKYEDIARELEIVKNYGIKVLGIVVLE